MIKVRIAEPLRKLTGGIGEVECSGKDIKELLENLDRKYAGIKNEICDKDGTIKRFVNIFVNDMNIRFLQGDETELKDGDEVSIIPAIAGGN